MTTSLIDKTEVAPTELEPEKILESLVGEGKKYKDHAALAKGKYMSDQHIANLEKELREMREELSQRLTVEKFVEQINSKAKGEDRGQLPPDDDQAKARDLLSKDDVSKLVNEQLTKAQEEARLRSNLSQVRDELVKTWGNDYVGKLRETMKELDLTQEQMDRLAAANPKAFLRVVLPPAAPKKEEPSLLNAGVPPKSSRSVDTSKSGQLESYKDFEALRKADPRTYFTPEVQNRMHKLASQKGSDFYK